MRFKYAINEVRKLLEELYPIRRALISSGSVKTMQIIENFVEKKIQITSFHSGQAIDTWTIPNTWELINLEIRSENGEKLFDLSDSNLRVVIGSDAFEGWVSIDEFIKHCYVHPKISNAIPYVTNYYGNPDWGVCLSQDELSLIKSKHKKIHVSVQSDSMPGKMQIGRLEVGNLASTAEQIFFSTYNCHPQMAHNELSGPIVWAMIAKSIIKKSSSQKLKYKYIFHIGPETIGAIALLSYKFSEMKALMKAGHVLTCLGIKSGYTFMPSRKGNTYADKALKFCLYDLDLQYEEKAFADRGSDERQYCFPGVDLPVCSMMTAKYHDYPEYHTNLDNLELISDEQLINSYNFYMHLIDIYETNISPRTKTIGEPMLSKYSLWQSKNIAGLSAIENKKILAFLAECDGQSDLIDIAFKLKLKYHEVLKIANALLNYDLITN